jgi:Concanavalin A-like lectin/glucanases superfamily/Fibronectin type III domain
MGGVGRRALWALFVIVAAAVVPAPSFAAAAAPRASVHKPAVTQAPDEQSARLAARQTGRRVEVMSGRTETTQVFANPSNTMTVEEHTQPFQVRRGAIWVPVDTTLRMGSNGAVSPVATVTDLVLSGGGAGPLARLGHQGREVSLSWPEPLSTPRLFADTATYAGVLPGVDLLVRATADGFSELLIVRTPQAAANPALARVRFTTATSGVSLGAGADGGLVAADAGGAGVFSAAAPAMWETAAAGDIEPRRAPVGLEVGSGELALVPDARMLADPTMRYPLTIDPFVTLGLRQWGNVTANAPNQGIAADPFRNEGTKAGYGCDANGCYRYRSLFAFPASPIYGKHILNATFGATLYHSWSCSDTPVELWLTGDINDGASWNNIPWARWLDTRSAHATSGCGGPVRMLFGNGLAGAVQDAANQGWPDVSIGLKATNESDVFQWKRFYTDVSLTIEYNSIPNQPYWLDTDQGKGCAVGGGRPWVSTTVPQLRAYVSDPDGDLLNAGVELWHTGGGWITTVWQNNVFNNAPAIVSAPAGVLADGGTYSWRVVASDGVDTSAPSGFCEFSIDATPPNTASAVTSTDYPADGSFHGSVGHTGHFVLMPPAVQPEHVAGYRVGLPGCGSTMCAQAVPASPVDHSGAIDITPAKVGPNQIQVWTVNRADLADGLHPLSYTYLVNPVSAAVADWQMSEGAGTTAGDGSGNGNDATLVGGTNWTSGRSNAGPALAFDGATGYATTAGPVQTLTDTGGLAPVHTNGSYTVSAWVKPSTVNIGPWYAAAVSSDGSRASAFFLRYSWAPSPRWRFDVTQSDTDNAPLPGVGGTSTVLTDRWTFVAGTYDAGTKVIRLYVNGVEEGNTTITGTFDSGGPVVIGRGKWLGQLNHYFPGAIGEVQMWDRVVSASELQTLSGPLLPTITLPGGPTSKAGLPIEATLSANGDANVTSYRYSLDDPALAPGQNTTLTATPPTPGGPVTVLIPAPAPTQSNLHHVYAKSVDARGQVSAFAQVQQVQVVDVPGAPSGVTASAGSGQATVSWLPPTPGGGSAITGYTVTATPGGRTASVDGLTTTATVTGLGNGTAYTFTVTATNSVGAGAASAPSSAVTPVTVPGAPTGLTALAGNAQAAVSWTAPVGSGGSAITGYTVTATPGGQTASVNGSTTTATVTGLTNATAYTFTVAATNAVGAGPASAASSSVTPTTTPAVPAAPAGTMAWAGNQQVTVSWTAPSSAGGSPVTGYTVTASPGGRTASAGATATSATVTGLTNGTAYTFTVTATNAVGTSAASAPSGSVTPVAAPGAPTGVMAVAGNAQAAVTWTAPVPNGGGPVTGYTVTASPGGQTASAGGTTTSATVTGLTNGTAYAFTVTATTSAGTGPESASSFPVTPSAPPGAPTGVTATAGNAQATVTWTAPASNGGTAISSYTVTASPGGQTVSVPASTTTAMVTGLAGGTAYTFTVTASNAAGAGAASAPSNSITPAAASLASDAFNRTVSGGWGTADAGGAWDQSGAPYSVSPGAAVIAGAGSDLGGELRSVSVRDTEYLVKVQLTPAADGTSYSAGIRARWSSGPTYYLVKLNFNSTHPAGWQWRPATVTGGTSTSLGVNTDAGFTPSVGVANTVWMRVRVSGSSPTQVQARAWNDGGAEPATWQLSFTDGTAGLQSAGAVGVSASNLSSATFDSFQATALPPATAPAAPTGVSAIAGNQRATVSWTAPASNGGSPLQGYTVTASPGGQSIGVDASATTATVGGLTNGTAYTFMVTATNSVGTGMASAPSNAVTPTSAAPLASDSFNRTVSGGWGSADVGGAWDQSGTAYSVSPGAAVIAGAGTDLGGELSSVSVRDAEYLVKVQITPAADGTPYSAGIRARWSSGPNYYLIKLNFNSSHPAGWQWRASTVVSGTSTTLPVSTDAGFAPTTGAANTVWMRVRVTGSGPTQVQARAWADGGTEPATWQLSFTDATAALQSAGAVGLAASNLSSATFESFQVTGL